MTDFKIKRGLSSVVFSEPGIINPNLIIEEGTWYLCTDTAELYLGITVDGELTLKQINGEHSAPTEGETTTGIVDAYIKEETGELWVVFADGSEKALGSVVGASEAVSIKIGENTFEAVDGIIELPEVTVPEVPTKVSAFENDAKYTTEQYVADAIDAAIEEHEDLARKAEVEEVKTKLEDEVIPTIQETIIPTVEELAEKAATQEWVQEQGYLTEHQSLEEYAKKADIPEARLFVVDFSAPDFTAAFEAYNSGKLLILTNAAPDPTGYAVMNYVREDKISFTKFLMSRSETYGAFNTYYLSPDNTWEISREVKLNKVEANVADEPTAELTSLRVGKEIYSLPSTDGLATETFVLNKIAEAELGDKDVDISGLATKDELSQVEAKIPSLDGYAKTEDIPTDYLTAIPEEYVTESELAEELAKIEHPKTDLTGYATEKFVEDAVAGIEIPDAYDDSELRSLIDSKADAEHTHDQYLTEHQDISHLATKEEIPDVSEFITSIPEEYITNDELEAKGYLTEHQSLEGYAKEEYVEELIEGIEIPETDLSEYSKTVDMNAAIKLATDVKADDIPFAESKIVGKDVGLFKAGDDVKGLTIAQILAKLLELSDNTITPEEPSVPDIPQSVVEKIMTNELPMYAVTGSGTVEQVPYRLISYADEASANKKPEAEENGFYQITKADGSIESGYQLISAVFTDMPFLVALPKIITKFEMQFWNEMGQYWETARYNLSADAEEFKAIMEQSQSPYEMFPVVDSETYTFWFNPDDGSTGAIYRFIINE